MTEDAPRLGRKRDPSRDADILSAAIEVLAEAGYAGMTMDLVAERAKAGKATVYRRWASKTELVLEAVASLKKTAVDLERLPDTGTLRGDLLALFKPQSLEQGKRTLKVMAALAALAHDERFTNAVTDVMVTPWSRAHRALMQRAVDRKEVSPAADLELLSKVAAYIAGFRTLIERRPFTREFLVSMIDTIVLPALGVRSTHAPQRRATRST